MLTLQNNADKIAAAMLSNTVVLVAPCWQVSDEHRLAAGRVVLDLLSQRSRLQPSYWQADGDESAGTVESLDGFAKLSMTIYFSIHGNSDVSLGTALAKRAPAELAAQAKTNHCWVNAFRTIKPNDETLIGIGNHETS